MIDDEDEDELSPLAPAFVVDMSTDIFVFLRRRRRRRRNDRVFVCLFYLSWESKAKNHIITLISLSYHNRYGKKRAKKIIRFRQTIIKII